MKVVTDVGEPIVLSLNRLWQILSYVSVERALNRMTGGAWGKLKPALAVPMDFIDGEWIISGIPTEWDDWIKLPVRDYDRVLRTAKGVIRCPMNIIRPNFSKLPLKKPRLSTTGILERDGFRCQYTGERLPRELLNVDHVLDRDHGGKSTWDNMVACRSDINFQKGNRTPEQAGLRLIKRPVEPQPIPVSFYVREPRLPEHQPFFNK